MWQVAHRDALGGVVGEHLLHQVNASSIQPGEDLHQTSLVSYP